METLNLIPGVRYVEPVKVKFKKKDGTEVSIDAKRISTRPVKINFKKHSESINKANNLEDNN